MPPAGEPDARTDRSQYLLAVSAAPDRHCAAAGDCGSGRNGCDLSAGGEAIAQLVAWPLAQYSRLKAGGHVSPGLSAARSAPEGRGLERSTDGDGGDGPEACGEGVVRPYYFGDYLPLQNWVPHSRRAILCAAGVGYGRKAGHKHWNRALRQGYRAK